MVNAAESAGQVAPPELEPVRALLNSWLVPNDTREPTDRFDSFARAQRWRRADAAPARELRDDLRRVVETGDCGPLNQWIDRLGVRLAVEQGAIAYRCKAGPAGEILAAVMSAISGGTWKRLKACPDCHWVFYDNTRNGSKRWCLMYAGGPDGRACGTIAKVRRYRDRHAAAAAN
jgi:predicted RNA-binding Zn ribbon-like protein